MAALRLPWNFETAGPDKFLFGVSILAAKRACTSLVAPPQQLMASDMHITTVDHAFLARRTDQNL